MNESVGDLNFFTALNLCILFFLLFKLRRLEKKPIVHYEQTKLCANTKNLPAETKQQLLNQPVPDADVSIKIHGLSDGELLNRLRKLSPRNFEVFVTNLFRKLGYEAQTTNYANDGGIDILLKKDMQPGFVQCKKYITKQVGVSEMRDFYGAISDRLPGGIAYFVTTNIFTSDARRFARTREHADSVKLIDAERLLKIIRLLAQKDIIVEMPLEQDFSSLLVCPKCHGGHLVRRKNRNSGATFMGCSNYPECKYAK